MSHDLDDHLGHGEVRSAVSIADKIRKKIVGIIFTDYKRHSETKCTLLVS